jgi:hypothetical protein
VRIRFLHGIALEQFLDFPPFRALPCQINDVEFEQLEMKPPQKGRIIRDPRAGGAGGVDGAVVSGGGVGGKNLGREETHLPTLLPHAPPLSSSRGPTKRMYSLDMSADYLNNKQSKQIISSSEVELENVKLKKLLQEAELSVQSYKSFLSQRSSLNNQNISTQTESYEDDEQENIDENQRKAFAVELHEIKQENLMLRNQMTLLQRNQIKVTEDYEQRILELEQNLKLFESKKKDEIKTKKKTTSPKLRPRKQNEVNHQELIITELNDFNELMRHNLDLIRSRLSSMNSAHNSTPKKFLNSPLKVIPVDHGCGPMTPISSTDRGHDPPTPSSFKPTGNGWNVTPILESQSNILDSRTISTNTDDSSFLSISRLEYQELENQLQHQATLVNSLTERLSSASKSVHGVVTKFGNEIHAIKHWAHCKELVRVASLRELGLEKDRLVNELKYSKYVLATHLLTLTSLTSFLSLGDGSLRDLQGVLWFCVETAEQMLTDLNPQLVTKLQESRQKRMLLLEREVKEKRKDIEQRSVETCAVSTTHLESFQLKAELKCKTAAEESQAVLLTLQNILHQK